MCSINTFLSTGEQGITNPRETEENRILIRRGHSRDPILSGRDYQNSDLDKTRRKDPILEAMRESEVQPGYYSAAAHHDQDNSPTLSSFTKEGRISYTPFILVRYRDLKGSEND